MRRDGVRGRQVERERGEQSRPEAEEGTELCFVFRMRVASYVYAYPKFVYPAMKNV